MKIALISGYNAQCGIATYAQELVPELETLAEVKVFAEDTGLKSEGNVVYCWSRNKYPNLQLLDELEAYKPDVAIINHEYGYFPQAYKLTSLVSWLRWKKIKTLGILHSVYENHLDKTVSEACFRNIMVHTEAAKNMLIKKGINPDCLTVIPHGCKFHGADNEILDKLWNHWGTKHVVFSAGFLFHYKGIHNTLKAIALLKEKYPDIHYILCGSENPASQQEHDKVYTEITDLANELGVIHNITINRGFFTEEVLLSYIRTASVCVLPYDPHPEHDVCATSGIARMIMQTSTPLITSNAHLFDDLGNLVERASGHEQLAQKIDDAFQDKVQSKASDRIKERKQFITQNSWKEAARKITELVASLK